MGSPSLVLLLYQLVNNFGYLNPQACYICQFQTVAFLVETKYLALFAVKKIHCFIWKCMTYPLKFMDPPRYELPELKTSS